jgi:hypothetical protein
MPGFQVVGYFESATLIQAVSRPTLKYVRFDVLRLASDEHTRARHAVVAALALILPIQVAIL